jgi:hypothetical protein
MRGGGGLRKSSKKTSTTRRALRLDDDDDDEEDEEEEIRRKFKSKPSKSKAKKPTKSSHKIKKNFQLVPVKKGKKGSVGLFNLKFPINLKEKLDDLAKTSQTVYKDVYRRAKVISYNILSVLCC